MKKRLLVALLGAAMAVSAMGSVSVMAAESEEALPGGGSNIIYVITPSVFQPGIQKQKQTSQQRQQKISAMK